MANGSRSSMTLALSPLRPTHMQSYTRGKTNVDGARLGARIRKGLGLTPLWV